MLFDPRPAVSSVTAAVAVPAITGAPAAAAAVLVGVPGDPAHTAEHDRRHDNGRQIEVCCQKFHHNNALLSARFEKFLLDLGNVDLDLVVANKRIVKT